MEKPIVEKRIDVRVPFVNTMLLEQLAHESAMTGITEARLLVQYATKFVEMSRGVVPVMATGGVLAASISSNGHSEVKSERDDLLPVQPSLDGESLDTLFGDPD